MTVEEFIGKLLEYAATLGPVVYEAVKNVVEGVQKNHPTLDAGPPDLVSEMDKEALSLESEEEKKFQGK